MTTSKEEDLWAKVFTETDGVLGVTEFANLPFVPQRFFWLSTIDIDAVRADHAHKTCHQLLMCLAGSLTATVTTVAKQVSVQTMSVGKTIHLAPMHWLELSAFSPDAVLGVLASEPFSQEEYITDRSKFFDLDE